MAEMSVEYDYATTHESPACAAFVNLARLYQRSADTATLGLLRGAAADVRHEMRAEPVPAPTGGTGVGEEDAR